MAVSKKPERKPRDPKVVSAQRTLIKKVEELKANEGVGQYAPKKAPKGDAATSGMKGKVAKGSKNPVNKLVNRVKRGNK
jgi:hypothetical protein